jgi:DNA mismatch repair protein MutS
VSPGWPWKGEQMFRSILFGDMPPPADLGSHPEPAFFHDLNLDQVVASVTAGFGDYHLEPFFYVPAAGLDEISYRHEVFRDLGDDALLARITAFTSGIRRVREQLALAKKMHYSRQRQRWFLESAAIYCDAVTSLAGDLRDAAAASRGLRGFRDYLDRYARSDGFTTLAAETTALRTELAGVTYSLHIKGNRVRVRKYEGEDDYSQEVLAVFEKFRQGAVKDYRVPIPSYQEMNHVEAGVLDLVTKLYPEVFAELDRYCAAHAGYLDGTIARFDREIQFYLAYLGHIRPFEADGLAFCYPAVLAGTRQLHAFDTFDLALAGKLAHENARVVTNDFSLGEGERILVVTGPNQGGKTTLARTFGQLHHLARLGCPVPGRGATLLACDELFTHFEKEEDLATLSGKLRDDLVRFREILGRATASSVIVMNEIFTSTTLDDALFLGREMLAKILGIGARCVCVTFLDELAALDPACVSMVAVVAPDNPAERTYKVVRKPADGLAYAAALAAKYGLTYDQLKGRLAS